MEEKRRRYGVIICVSIVTLSILAGVGIYQFKRANHLENLVKNQYTRAFHELTDYVKDVDFLLKKSMLVSGAEQVSHLASEIYMQASAAKTNLALLPVSDIDLSATSKFLSQAGDYAAYLAKKVIGDGEITEDEYGVLEKLSDYAETVSKELSSMEEKLQAGQVSFEEKKGSSKEVYAAEDEEIGTGFAGIEKSFQDYPSLVYDGPFSEHIEAMKPAMTADRPGYDPEEARQVAASFLENERGDQLLLVDESGGKLPSYNFRVQTKEERDISISVTKQGGYVLYMLDNREVKEKKLSINRATELARAFLRRQGMFYVENSYYDESDNVATLNFAAVQEGVTLYADLIKVKVALDNGEIVGYEAKGYLMSHKARKFPDTILSEDEAKKTVSSRLRVYGAGLAVIPTDSQEEKLCYEFKGQFKDDNFLIYINAETGKEEEILMLVETESGVLTV